MPAGPDYSPPTMPWLLRKIARAAIRRPRHIPHLLAAMRAGLRLRAQRAGRPPGPVIACVEHMGDIIAAEPVARYAARQHPGKPVTWVCRDPYRAAVQGFSAVDAIVTVGCITEWLFLWADDRREGVYDLHISDRHCPVCRVGFRKPGRAGKIGYETYYDFGNLLSVNCLVAGIPVLDESPRVSPGPAAADAVDALSLPDRFVVIHAKSNEDRRDWDADKWRQLLEWLTGQAGLFVCEVGTTPVVVTRDTPQTRNLCGKLTLMQTAEIIARAALYIGIDSGPAHLANAAGTPGIILLGRYHKFARYTPFSGGYADGARADLLRTTGLPREITLEAVIAAASRRLHLPAAPTEAGAQRA